MNGKQAHMKLSFGQHLSQKQVQTLAPRMIQSMEILQMPLVELNERIEQELIENPVLELREKDPSLPDEAIPQDEAPQKRDVDEKELIVDEAHHNADDFERLVNLDQEVPSYFEDQARPSSNRIQESSDRYQDLMANVAERSETLQDHLLQQLGEWELEPALRKMCERIISALKAEDGGYLRVAIRDLLPADAAPDQLELAEEALSIVQSLDPPGVAARDLRECLLLQLNVEIPHYQDVRTLIQNHLEDLRDNRIPQIQKATGFSQSQLQEALAELRKLEPKPARRFVESYAPSVTPDLSVVQEEGGRYLVKMDEGPSRNLYISKYYRQRLANGQATKEEREFIKRKVNAAQWLIEAIVDYQTKFLDNGPEFIEPLKMQQIADQVGVHVTTVSRAVDDKWIETPRGIFPLRRFFAGGTQTEDGEDIAWDRIRIELQKLVDHEDKSDPLSDDEIVKRMGAAGLKVARRTVTKYRQKMGIPSSRQRKDWSK
jgi:RNA polymerase sigma-54 factor